MFSSWFFRSYPIEKIINKIMGFFDYVCKSNCISIERLLFTAFTLNCLGPA